MGHFLMFASYAVALSLLPKIAETGNLPIESCAALVAAGTSPTRLLMRRVHRGVRFCGGQMKSGWSVAKPDRAWPGVCNASVVSVYFLAN